MLYNNGADCTAPKHIFTTQDFFDDILSIPNTYFAECINIDHFRPEASVSVYTDLNELIGKINQYQNRLGLHLYTKSLKIQRLVSEKARWGTIFVNKPLTVPVEMPHSGLGLSGNTFNQSFFKLFVLVIAINGLKNSQIAIIFQLL